MNALVPGSLAAIAAKNKASLAESFLNVDALVMIDMSGSMSMGDGPGGMTRFAAAEAELVRLQEAYPGKIGVIAFSDNAQFCPTGRPPRLSGGTNMVAALQMAIPVDGTGVRFILISDGQPDDERKTLEMARRFTSRIDTVYIGPEDGWLTGGRDFLQRLAKATGGQSLQGEAPGLLAAQVVKLLAAA